MCTVSESRLKKNHHACRRPAAQIKARRLLGGFKELPSSHYIAGFHVKCWWNALRDPGLSIIHWKQDNHFNLEPLLFIFIYYYFLLKVIHKWVVVLPPQQSRRSLASNCGYTEWTLCYLKFECVNFQRAKFVVINCQLYVWNQAAVDKC